jgi:hypothetical protein
MPVHSPAFQFHGASFATDPYLYTDSAGHRSVTVRRTDNSIQVLCDALLQQHRASAVSFLLENSTVPTQYQIPIPSTAAKSAKMTLPPIRSVASSPEYTPIPPTSVVMAPPGPSLSGPRLPSSTFAQRMDAFSRLQRILTHMAEKATCNLIDTPTESGTGSAGLSMCVFLLFFR